jgi:hypothetical protein
MTSVQNLPAYTCFTGFQWNDIPEIDGRRQNLLLRDCVTWGTRVPSVVSAAFRNVFLYTVHMTASRRSVCSHPARLARN